MSPNQPLNQAPNCINLFVTNSTPQERKDLLEIYKDYIYFVRRLEIMLHKSTFTHIANQRFKQVGWSKKEENKDYYTLLMPCEKIDFSSSEEHDAYKKFVDGNPDTNNQYVYISLSHIDRKEDSPLSKINTCPDGYSLRNIDLFLPSPVERSSIAFHETQKLNGSTLIIDGMYKITYYDQNSSDLTIAEALDDKIGQEKLRILLCYAHAYSQTVKEYVADPSVIRDIKSRIGKPDMPTPSIFKQNSLIITHNEKRVIDRFNNLCVTDKFDTEFYKATAIETISLVENKILDLLGSCAEKAKSILDKVYSMPKNSLEEAEKEGLIPSAETMQDFINIRNLMRHQWDTGFATFGRSAPEHNSRSRYLDSCLRVLNSKQVTDRPSIYMKYARHFQPLIKMFFPEFLPLEQGESKNQYFDKLSSWIEQNPKKPPLIMSGYPLFKEPYNTKEGLVRDENLSSFLKRLDNTKAPYIMVPIDFLTSNTLLPELEDDYTQRAEYLRSFSYVYSDMQAYCSAHKIKYDRNKVWQDLLRKRIISFKEYMRWNRYNQLRNNLSHKYFSETLRDELHSYSTTFPKDLEKLRKELHEHTPISIMNNGNQEQQPDNDPPTQPERNPHTPLPKSSRLIELKCYNRQVAKCIFKNGITINLNSKSINLPGNVNCYLNGDENYAINLGNDTKIFMDKDFTIKSYREQKKTRKVSRNETFTINGHTITTDQNQRLSKISIKQNDGSLLGINMQYSNDDTYMEFPDGTKLSVKNDDLVVSHNGITLNFANKIDFINSYNDDATPQTPSVLSRDQNSR